MVLSLYVMPIVGTGATRTDARRPKYRDSVFPLSAYSMFDYGNEPWCLTGINNVDPTIDATLNGEPDVFELPTDLNQAMGSVGVRNTVRNRLEAVNIPGTWVQTTTTYREVVEMIGSLCQFAQRYQGATGGLWFTGGITLDSTFSSLPQTARDGMISAAASFGMDTSGFTGASTLRQILQGVGQQYVALGLPLVLASVNLYTA